LSVKKFDKNLPITPVTEDIIIAFGFSIKYVEMHKENSKKVSPILRIVFGVGV